VVATSAGWCLGVCAQSMDRNLRQPLYVAAIAVLVFLVRYEASFYLRPPDDWSRIQMGSYGNVMIEARKLAGEIDSLLRPDETFCQLANEPELYYYSRRRPPTGFLCVWPALETQFPAHSRFAEQIIADLAREKPELLVITVWSVQGDLAKEPFVTVLKNYRLLPGNAQRGVFILLCLKGGKLESRLQSFVQPATTR
jgi:hypothetical protein